MAKWIIREIIELEEVVTTRGDVNPFSVTVGGVTEVNFENHEQRDIRHEIVSAKRVNDGYVPRKRGWH